MLKLHTRMFLEVHYEKKESIGVTCVVPRIHRISHTFFLCIPIYGTMGLSNVEFSTFTFCGTYGINLYTPYAEEREKGGVNKIWTCFLFLTCSEISFQLFFWMGYG
jgi:hypothetical protein